MYGQFPNEFIGFVAMDERFPYEFVGFGAMKGYEWLVSGRALSQNQ